MRYKKTIRRKVQETRAFNRRMANVHCWAINRLARLRADEKLPQEHKDRQAFLRGLTNWESTILLRYLDGESVAKVSVQALKIYLDQERAKRMVRHAAA